MIIVGIVFAIAVVMFVLELRHLGRQFARVPGWWWRTAVLNATQVEIVVVGLSPEAAVGAVLLSGLAALFYHWSVRTPYWIGFVFQRPESHCFHHECGVHFYNFSDLPLWDMMFATFRNPREFAGKCGFRPTQERRRGSMLLAVDVLRAAEWGPDGTMPRGPVFGRPMPAWPWAVRSSRRNR